MPDDIDGRLGEIEAAIEAFEDRPLVFSVEQMSRAGVFISLRADGSLLIDRGRVRPEDEALPERDNGEAGGSPDADDVGTPGAVGQPAIVTVGHDPASAEDGEEAEAAKPLPESLVTELTAFRTLALRDAVATHPHVALTALLHRLVLDGFGSRTPGAALEALVRTVHLPVQAPGLADSQPAASIAARHAAWQADPPLGEDDDRLWTCLDGLDDPNRLALLAHCISSGVNALHERPNPYSGTGVIQAGLERRLREADRLARATGLDIVEAGWRPTAESYLGRVTKTRILEAVCEGVGEAAAQFIDHLKKPDMVREAERLLADTGWLPEPLRAADLEADADLGTETITVTLPAYLTKCADRTEADEEADAATRPGAGEGDPQGMAAE